MSNKQVITGEAIPKSFLPFSPAMRAGDFVFISGQASVDKEGNIIEDSFEEECRRSFENLGLILGGAGLDFSDVVKVQNFLGKPEYRAAFNEIYKEFFSFPFPARTTIVGCLGDLLKFEVDAVAYIKK